MSGRADYARYTHSALKCILCTIHWESNLQWDVSSVCKITANSIISPLKWSGISTQYSNQTKMVLALAHWYSSHEVLYYSRCLACWYIRFLNLCCSVGNIFGVFMLAPWFSSVPLSHLVVMWQLGMTELFNDLPHAFFEQLFRMTSWFCALAHDLLPPFHHLTWQMTLNNCSVHLVSMWLKTLHQFRFFFHLNKVLIWQCLSVLVALQPPSILRVCSSVVDSGAVKPWFLFIYLFLIHFFIII